MDTNHSETIYHPCLEALDSLGFCTLKVFDDEQIEKLRSLYQENFGSKIIEQLYSSHNSNPIEQSLKINSEIKNIVNESIQRILPGFTFFIGHFVVKGAHVNKEFSLHQDWNIVDESKHRSYQVWIPLQLACPTNGGIFVMPGSHRFLGNYRSGSYGIPVIRSEEKLKQLITDIIVPPGNALIYHNGLFHASHPNTTDSDRIAVIANYVENSAPTYYFHKNAEQERTELYAITGEKLITHLHALEKGIIDESLTLSDTKAICPTKNEEVGSADLIVHYRNKVGKVNAAQLKQLHVTVGSDLEQKLNQEGYAVIDLLDLATIDLFKKEYNLHFGNLDRTPGRFTTLQDTDAVLKKQMHNFIVANVDAPLRKYFKEFIIPVSQFYTKKAFTSGDIDLHADSTLLLNHQLEPHYAIWVPLIAVDSNNGALTIIPLSHKVNRAVFGSSFGGYHNQHLEWLRKYEVPLILKAGQAVIFDNNMLHNSTANNTSIDRLCFTFRLTHFASQYYSFFSEKPEEGFVDVSEESHNYYMADDWDGNSKHLTGEYKGTFKNYLTKLPKEELEIILNSSIIEA